MAGKDSRIAGQEIFIIMATLSMGSAAACLGCSGRNRDLYFLQDPAGN